MQPGASVNFEGGNTVSSPDNSGLLRNLGTINKTGDGVTQVLANFQNDGVVNVSESSQWSLNRNAEHSGTFNLVDADNALTLHNSTHTFSVDSSVIGNGGLHLHDSSKAIIEGHLDIGDIVIDGGSTLDMRYSGRTKTLEFANGTIAGGAGLTITEGVVITGDAALAQIIHVQDAEVQPSGIMSINIGGGFTLPPEHSSIGVLTNNGKVTKTGAGNSTIELKTNNRGSITVSGESGLVLPNGFEQYSGTLIVDGKVIFDSWANVYGGKIQGSGTIQCRRRDLMLERVPRIHSRYPSSPRATRRER